MTRKRPPAPPAERPGMAVMVVNDPRAIAFLSNQSNMAIVGGLIERECSVGEMAEEFKVPIKNLAARVYRMVQLGLARQTGERARNGRAIKCYRSLAERFILAPADGSTEGLIELQKARFYPFLDRLVEAQVAHLQDIAQGRLVVQVTYDFADEVTSGQWCAQRPDGSLHPLPEKPFQHAWGNFQLKPDDTAEFVRDMQALVERYTKRNCAEGEFVMCVSSVVPQERRRRPGQLTRRTPG